MSKIIQKDYIGDGVYVDFDGYDIVLTTEDGVSVTNVIHLEPQVLRQFDAFRARLKEALTAGLTEVQED